MDVEPGRCSIRITRRYAAPRARVWAALTGRESLARRLARPRSLDLREGGTLELELGDASVVLARVRELEPERRLVLEWRHPGEEESLVLLELADGGPGETVLVLDHSRLAEPVGMTWLRRWAGPLDRLAAVA